MSGVVLLCFGGRTFHDHAAIDRALSAFRARLVDQVGHGNFAVLHGNAKGADRNAGSWARKQGLCVMAMDAPWEFYDKKAGPLRNQWLLTYGRPTHAIGFPGHSGTRDMAQRVNEAGLWLWQP